VKSLYRVFLIKSSFCTVCAPKGNNVATIQSHLIDRFDLRTAARLAIEELFAHVNFTIWTSAKITEVAAEIVRERCEWWL